MVMAYLSNLFLAGYGVGYQYFIVLQSGAYFLAFVSPLFERMGYKLKLAYIFYYFSLINLAAGHAFIKFILGKKQVLWSPRKG